MRIGGFQKLTLLDYPGQVACLVFAKGCNFRCPFCQNSDLVRPEAETEEIAEEEVLAYLRRRRGILDGVVISGGEPLLQPDLADFLRKIKEMDYLVKLDTNGSLPERLRALLAEGLIDAAAMDVKAPEARYGACAGFPGRPEVSRRLFASVMKSLEVLRAAGIPFELRTTLVKGLHTAEDLRALAREISGNEPYFLQSYEDSGRVLAPEGLSAFSQEEMAEMLAAVREEYPGARAR